MIVLRKLIFCLIFIFANNSYLYAEVLPPAPATSTLQSMGASFSFSNTESSTPEVINQIQTFAATAVDRQQLVATVEKDAKALGLKVNKALLARMAGDKSSEDSGYLEVAGTNKFTGRTDLEPTLDTYVYDTGLVELVLEDGYNNDASSKIFSTADQAQMGRVKVYIDFKKQAQWGDVETRVTLTGGTQKTNILAGGASAVTSIPIDRQLNHTIVNGVIPDQDYAGFYDKHSVNSLKQGSGMATFVGSAEFYGATEQEEKDFMKESMSFGSGGRGDVMVGAQFRTATAGSAGTSTISLEGAGAAANASDADYIASLVRYSKTVTTEAKKFEPK